MTKLNLPEYSFRFRKNKAGKTEIFDDIRKRFYILTPEEWVRQNFIRYLIHVKNFPASLMAVEKGLKLNGMQKRADIVQYNTHAHPVLIVECKAPEVKITQDTFDQIARYNMVMKVRYLIITNGLQHYACRVDFENRQIDFLKDIPEFKDLQDG